VREDREERRGARGKDREEEHAMMTTFKQSLTRGVPDSMARNRENQTSHCE
jgi:hypothetical protein